MDTRSTATNFQDWAQVRAALAPAIAALRTGDALVVGEPAQSAARTGLLRRAKPLPSRYVQFAADGESVVAECVGAVSFGGDWDISDDVDAALVGLGWVHPEPNAFPNYRHDARLADAERLALLAVESLQLLGTSVGDVGISHP